MIKIVTDYHASLPADLIEKYDVTIIPSYILYGAERLKEGVDFTMDEFYERLTNEKKPPVTNPPYLEDFVNIYEGILKKHPDATLLSIHFSSRMSETYNLATLAAKKLPEARIHIFDSLTAGVAEGIMVCQAGAMAQEGADVETILDHLQSMRPHTRVFFLMDTLDYLAAGGRIGKATFLIGSTIRLKPMLTLVDGEVTSYARFTSREKALVSLKSLVTDVTKGKSGVHIAVTHARCLEDAQTLAEGIRAAVEPETLFIGDISPVVGVHTGPGAIGAAWYVAPDAAPAAGNGNGAREPDDQKKEKE